MFSNNTNLLLDSARLENRIVEAKQFNQNYLSLYQGRSEEDLAAVAPYLFTYGQVPEFEKWFVEKCWGDS